MPSITIQHARGLMKQGQRAAAEQALRQLLEQEPLVAEAWFLLGQTLYARRDVAGGDLAFARARHLDVSFQAIRLQLVDGLMQKSEFGQAAAHLEALLRESPDWTPALLRLAHCLLRLGEAGHALAAAERAEASGAGIEALEWRAAALEALSAPPAQLLPLRQEIAAAKPDSAAAWFRLAVTSSRLGEYGPTHQALDRTLALQPRLLAAAMAKFMTPQDKFHASRHQLQEFLDRWDAGLAAFAQHDFDDPALRPQLPGLLQAQSNFHLAYTGADVTPRQKRFGTLLTRLAQHALPQFSEPPKPPARTRMRIGFVSGVLYRHTVMKLFGGVVRGLPRDRFEVLAYATEGRADTVTETVRAEIDGVVAPIDDLAAQAARIATDCCDVLVYLDVGMSPRSMALAALRLAPRQALLWGHPVTTGLPSMDVFFSCAAMEPATGQAHYSERLFGLPGPGCWFDERELPSAAWRPPSGRQLVCAQNAVKLLPEQDAVFARILAGLPGWRLRLLSGLTPAAAARLRQRLDPVLQDHGVDPARVTVSTHCSESEFLAHCAEADLVLDTLAWSGGVTALETLSQNRPILSLPGTFMRGRHSAAFLQQLDLPELIAEDEADFVRRAIELGRNADQREALSHRINERKAVLYRQDAVKQALADQLQEWCASAS